MADFRIGQVFEDTYPPEAAEWCNRRGDCFIEEAGENSWRIASVSDISVEERMRMLRMVRNARLAETDYLLMPDYPLADATAIKAYRQALRDMPTQAGAPWDGGGEATPWPVKPK